MNRLPDTNTPTLSSLQISDDIPALNIDAVEKASKTVQSPPKPSNRVPRNHEYSKAGVQTPDLSPANPKLEKRWSVGRAPWYDETGASHAPFIIGVSGGSASGKTSVCRAIVEKLNIPWVGLLSMDRYYRGLTPEEIEAAHQGNYNFDHPDAFDTDALYDTIMEMRTGRAVDVPIYDFPTHSRLPHTDRMYGADIVIVEGILLFYDKKVRDLLDLKIYVDTDSDIRLARRIIRDIHERGRTVASVLDQYTRSVKPSFEEYILPTKRFADLIMPWNETNHVAVELLHQHISMRLEKRGTEHARNMTRYKGEVIFPNGMPEQITVLERTRAMLALQTVIRDKATDTEEFNFHIGRLVRQLSNAAISMLDFHTCSVTTPTQVPFHGLDLSSRISAVSIVRTGEIFETAIRSVLPDVPVGKIVIDQNDQAKQEFGPRLYYAKLPANLATDDSTVMLFDGVLATGGAVSMAVHVLKDHGVPEDKIIFCCIVAAPEGLQKLHRMFPRLRVVTSWVDDGLDKNGYCKPGMGYLGERYFGTQ